MSTTADSISSLNDRFALDGAATISAGNGGLPRVAVATELAVAEIYLHGAHVTAFQPAGEKPVLWLSSKSAFEPGRAIRGGVPVCFPWFGANVADAKLPAHGFARLVSWDLKSIDRRADGAIAVVLGLESNDETKQFWPAPFKAVYTITVGRRLELRFEVFNPADQLMTYELALHTYLQVGDVRQISVAGLENTTYLDKPRAHAAFPQGPSAIHFVDTVDRVYLDATGPCTVDDSVLGRVLRVDKIGSEATVVWNPFLTPDKKPLPDVGDGEWRTFVCVETANVRQACVTLSEGETHATTAVIGVGNP